MRKPNRLRRARNRTSAAIPKQRRVQSDLIDDELTPAQIRELDRRLAEHRDPTRYLLVSQLTPRFVLSTTSPTTCLPQTHEVGRCSSVAAQRSRSRPCCIAESMCWPAPAGASTGTPSRF